MAPRAVHFIRHAEGYHNSEENENIPDPDLTPKGREQCKQLAKTFPYFDRIDLVCASPIRRAIQTASISMEPHLQSGKIKILALPLAQEATDKPANTPSDIGRLQKEYGDIVDFHRCLDTYTDFNTKKGRWSPDGHSLQARALELRRFLRDREEQEIVIVSHGDFLHYVSGDIDEEGNQQKGWWTNTEFRSYRFYPVGHDEALLQETDESVKMRNASGPGEAKDTAAKNRE
ncbi:histidine phosphatase superfamily [Phaeosphaeria sp. MPI-PUGE-AT-0046c]|nr:histidine phosphatase superfamily [Phaeosphaeria sp. MPI-PUGE-AT-0046c]